MTVEDPALSLKREGARHSLCELTIHITTDTTIMTLKIVVNRLSIPEDVASINRDCFSQKDVLVRKQLLL